MTTETYAPVTAHNILKTLMMHPNVSVTSNFTGESVEIENTETDQHHSLSGSDALQFIDKATELFMRVDSGITLEDCYEYLAVVKGYID